MDSRKLDRTTRLKPLWSVEQTETSVQVTARLHLSLPLILRLRPAMHRLSLWVMTRGTLEWRRKASWVMGHICPKTDLDRTEPLKNILLVTASCCKLADVCLLHIRLFYSVRAWASLWYPYLIVSAYRVGPIISSRRRLCEIKCFSWVPLYGVCIQNLCRKRDCLFGQPRPQWPQHCFSGSAQQCTAQVSKAMTLLV